MPKENNENLKIKIKEVKSVTEEQIQSVMNLSQVKKYFEGNKYRILSTQFFEADKKEKQLEGCKSSFSDFHQITAYDYIRNRCVLLKLNHGKKNLLKL